VFDLIVVGAGLGGLSFLWHLLESGTPPQRVLVIDKDFEARDDRTWCFWGPKDAPFADIATARWSEAEVRTRSGQHHTDLGELFYHCVPSGAFRKRVLERIERTPWITCLSADVADLGEDDWGAYVETSLGRFVGTWMVQSIRFMGEDAERAPRYPVRQHFGGLEVRTQTPVFDPDRFTLMDFSVPQRDGATFVYVLPFAPDRALIEHTMFSATPLSAQEHFEATEAYLKERFDVPFEIVRREAGNIPMDDRYPSQRAHPHVFNIGIAGGQIKPCTGYTFARVQRYAAALASTYAQEGELREVAEGDARFRLYDQLLLRVLHDEPERAIDVFETLLTRAPLDTVLGFLDEQSHLMDEALLFARLPKTPFLKGLPLLALNRLPAWAKLPALPMGLCVALGVYVAWALSFAVGLSGNHPGAGTLTGDGLWIALQTFLSTGVFISGHEAMHGLVAPGRPKINRAIGWLATWSYAGLDYDVLAKAHHEHHDHPATEHDPDYHRGNPNYALWYLDFMREYVSVRQIVWLCLLWGTLIGVLQVGLVNGLLFWATPLVLSTLQLFTVGTWFVHRPGEYLGDGHLRARSLDVHPALSFVACYHFGYHFEHHARPDLPWWTLWQVRGLRPNPSGNT
jgi:lycopene cyclase-like protein